MKSRIYFFTGTGNSLKAAKEIAAALPDCELVAIRKGMDSAIPADCQRIGFVFPVYFWGSPAMVANFIKNADFSKQDSTYFFAVATHGGSPGAALPYMRDILCDKGVQLNYSGCIKILTNAVFKYNISRKVEEIIRKSNERIAEMVPDIAAMKQKPTASTGKLMLRTYLKSIAKVHDFGNKLNVSDDCISCGICQSVCPAKNIELRDGRPVFQHQCECCLACLQHCPKKAINYMRKTQSRRRYTHPEIGHKEISKYYKH